MTQPRTATYYFQQGNALGMQRQFEAAIANYDKAIALKPQYASAYSNRGVYLFEMNRFDEAIASYDCAIASDPNNATAFINRGNALYQIKRYQEAIESSNQAIAINPASPSAFNHRGSAHQALKQYDQAIASFKHALSIQPDFVSAIYNLGNAYRESVQNELALESYNQAIKLSPDYADAYANRGVVLQALGQYKEAMDSYNQALRLNPDFINAQWNKSLLLLLTGHLKDGWQLYETRFQGKESIVPPRHFPKPIWLGGSSIRGKTLLIHSEQGLGDTIQFSRYLPLLSDSGAQVIAAIPANLKDLFASSLRGNITWVDMKGPWPTYDLHCPMLSLPLAFKTTLSNIPSPHAYLRVDHVKRQKWAAKLPPSTRPRIGLVWSGSTTHTNDHQRSILLSEIWTHLPKAYDYVCVQKELRDVDQTFLAQHPTLSFFGDELSDFSETAALCANLDLLISVDTSVAHLSAALGVPTWLLLPFAPDWRWLLARDDCPWYDSVRLFRQDQIHQWSGVLQRLSACLTQTLPTH